MTHLKLTLLAAAAIGAASIGGASALPMSGSSPAIESNVQHVRVVCNQRGVCWDSRSPRRTWRSGRNGPRYVQPQYGYGYPQYGYQQPGVGIGVGPFGVWVR